MPVEPKRRIILLDDAMWTVARYDAAMDTKDGPLLSGEVGEYDPEKQTISFRLLPADEMKRALIHEGLHHAFGINARISEKKMNAADGKMVRYLEAFGVDLSPMLRGYK